MFLISENYWEVRKTKLKGRGVFAKKQISKGTIIGDYLGSLISLEQIDFDEEKRNMYLVYYKDEVGIYPDLSKPGIHLINHSCNPNCWIYIYLNHTLVFALNDISSKEELTISYLLPPRKNCEPCTHRCYCGNFKCRHSMHLTEEAYLKWQNFQKVNSAYLFQNVEKVSGKVLLPLKKYPKSVNNEYMNKINNLYL